MILGNNTTAKEMESFSSWNLRTYTSDIGGWSSVGGFISRLKPVKYEVIQELNCGLFVGYMSDLPTNKGNIRLHHLYVDDIAVS